MSEIINQNPPPEDPKTVRQAIITQFSDLKAKAEAIAAERAAAEPPAEEVEGELEPAAPVPEPAPEPEPAAAAVASRKPAGRPSFEQRMRNIQSIQDKRFNELTESLQQLASAISQVQQQVTARAGAPAPEAEEDLPPEYSDPNFIKAIEREAEKVLQKKYGLNPRSAASLQRNSIIAEYRAINRDYAEYDPAVTAIVARLPESIPMSVELLTAIKQGAADVLWGAFQAWNQSLPPAQAGAATGQNPQTQNQDGSRQITHDQASALRQQSRSLRTETGENAGANMQVQPADVRQAVALALRGRQGRVPR